MHQQLVAAVGSNLTFLPQEIIKGISGKFIYRLAEDKAPRPGFVASSNQQVCLTEISVLGPGCPPGNQDPNEPCAAQTLATQINQLHTDKFKGTSIGDVNIWLRTLETRFHLLNIP